MRILFKSVSAILIIGINSTAIVAQVVKTSLVEHFTNTSCSVCANNNNGYYNIINNYPNTLHISFHPSSPYSNDFFNQQNQVENDARTNFYGVFGSTPRLVVNGAVITNSNLNNTLSASSTATSNFEVLVRQEQVSGNDFNVSVVLKKVANDNLVSATLFVGVSEDTIYQTTNNGENVHYNVFRKALSATVGNCVTLPVNIGDSTVSTFNYTAPSNWNVNRLHTIALLQKADKSMINAAKSINSVLNTTGIFTDNDEMFSIFPNPVKSGLFYMGTEADQLEIINITGQVVRTINGVLQNQSIDVSSLNKGVYILRIKKDINYSQHKIIIE